MDCILYLYHKPMDSGRTRQHLMLLKTLNPSTRIVPLSFYDHQNRRSMMPKEQWRNADLLVYDWFARTNPGYDRYFIIEWDTFCTMSLKEFYGAAYDQPAVGATVIRPWSMDPVPGYGQPMREWHWFTHGNTPDIYPFLRGIIPLCGAMFSRDAMTGMVKSYSEIRDVDRLHCECRIATLARLAGFEPSRINDEAHLYISPKKIEMKETRGVWHPVK